MLVERFVLTEIKIIIIIIRRRRRRRYSREVWVQHEVSAMADRMLWPL